MEDAIKGLLVGGFMGFLSGLGLCIWVFTETLWFTGNTVAIGSVVGSTFGYFLGDRFFDWVGENWWWFM